MISSEKKSVARVVATDEKVQGWEFSVPNGSKLGVSPDGQYVVSITNKTPWIWRWLLSPQEVVTILYRKSGTIWTISMPEPNPKAFLAQPVWDPFFTFHREGKDGEQLAVEVHSFSDHAAIFYLNGDSPPTLAKGFRMNPIKITNGGDTIEQCVKNGKYSLAPINIVRLNKEQSVIGNGWTFRPTLFHCKNLETDAIVEIEHAHPVTEYSFREIDGVLHALTQDNNGLTKLVPLK